MKIDYDDEFRQRWSKRRDLAVSIVAAAVESESIETEFERLKAATRYEQLHSRDQANFRRFCSDLRTVWNGWKDLHAHEREAFLAHEVVYSTLANELRRRSA